MRGDIRNKDYACQCRHYGFSKLRQWMPGLITPSDIDTPRFIERRGYFLWLEFKTVGAQMPVGQRISYEALLKRGAPVETLIVAAHDDLRTVDVPNDIVSFRVYKWDRPKSSDGTTSIPGKIYETEPIRGADIGEWIQDWFKHAEEKPNSFVTNFRKATGVYKTAS